MNPPKLGDRCPFCGKGQVIRPSHNMKGTSKIEVTIEFDDPVFVEIYKLMAMLRGETIGQLAGKAMQQAMGPIKDHQTLVELDECETWIAEKLEGKDELTTVGI